MKNLERSYPGDMQDVPASTLSRSARTHRILLSVVVETKDFPSVRQEFKSEIERALAGQDGTTEVDYEKARFGQTGVETSRVVASGRYPESGYLQFPSPVQCLLKD